LNGKGNQQFLKKSYEADRQKALLDRTRFTDEELENLEITGMQGTGRTDYRKYQVWQWPYPTDNSIRRKKKIDLRERPQIGGKF